MSSAKTERLVNLTMALLASPRYLQKSEIFRRVAGYEGSQETKERMFERDKDDLRSMGIDIEVASPDPLFEDEPGYRIKPEKFQLPIDAFDGEELSILATALGLWSESEFSTVTSSALRRIGGEAEKYPSTLLKSENHMLTAEGLVDLSRALAARSTVTFAYQKLTQENAETRRVNPLGLSGWRGAWYLVGEDLERKDIRVFKLSRIQSRIEISSKRGTYEIPKDFDVRDYLVMYNKEQFQVEAAIRKGSGNEIRSRATSVTPMADEALGPDWDLVIYQAENLDAALKEALWFSDVVVVRSPVALRELVITSLKKVMAKHG